MRILHPFLRTLACVSILVAGGVPAFAKVGDNRVGNWVADKETCTISASFRNGQSLIVVVEAEARYALYLRSIHWELPPRYAETVLYWADRENPRRAVARYQDIHTVRIGVGDPDWVETAVNHADAVSFVFGEKTYRIPITHGGRVAGWIEHCAQPTPARPKPEAETMADDEPVVRKRGSETPIWLSLTANTSPVQTPRPPEPRLRTTIEPDPSRRQLSPARGSQALEFMAKVLAQSSYRDAKVDVPGANRVWPVEANAVWERGPTRGAVRRYRQLTDDQLHIEEKRIRDHDRRACRGQFSSSRLPANDPRLTSLVTVCLRDNSNRLPDTRVYLAVTAANSESFLLMVEQPELALEPAWQNSLAFATAALSASADWTEKTTSGY